MKRVTIIMILVLLSTVVAQGQITIGGNVYGGGNEGEVKGNTTVVVKAGNIGARGTASETPLANPRGKVFGGARMADVGGNTFVHIDGKEATADMVINQVFGGNDIAGSIGKSEDATIRRAVPTALSQAARDEVDNTWNSMVLVSSKNSSETEYSGTTGDVVTTHATASTESVKKIFIGQLFGGGNGDYRYADKVVSGNNDIYRVYNLNDPDTPIATKTTARGGAGFTHPDLAKSYVDVHGGTIVYAYGGGNSATITQNNVIRVENPSAVVTSMMGYDAVGDVGTPKELLTSARFHEMGVASKSGYSHYQSDQYQVAYFFGGNNKDTMAIRPTWHLVDGKIRTLYSGGNRGPMIYHNGLFLEVPETSRLEVGDLYGGCRMADVRPMEWDPNLEVEGQTGLGGYVDVDEVNNDIPNYTIPRNLAARVVISGGKVHNVYGGNDITGRVYFGNAIGIRSSISGNVYGGGNGSYAYTDNLNLKNDENYADFYYDKLGKSAVEALLDVRPNAEQVSIHIRGKDKDHPTIIGGSVFIGGNSATLKTDDAHKNLENYPLTELKIGSWVIADNVYLGNNGEGMVTINAEEKDAQNNITKEEGILRTYKSTYKGYQFNSMDLTDAGQMKTYMQGVAMSQVPRLSVDVAGVDREDYVPYTSFIGSLFFGGNRGSMTYSGPVDITPQAPIYIYEKLVGGCNNANVPRSDYNARYEGGILGSADESFATGEPNYFTDNTNSTIRDRVVMNLSKINVVPMRLKASINWDQTANWNTIGWDILEWSTYNLDGEGKYVAESLASTPISVASLTSPATLPTVTELSTGPITATGNEADFKRRLVGGNIYGGCHQSGHVNGSVVINLKSTIHPRHDIFDAFSDEEVGDDILYDRESYDITARHSGVILNEQGVDVLGDALSVYGGGRGQETEIWGSASVNVERGYTFQIFGGSEEGAIGKGSWQESGLDGSTGYYKGAYTYPTVSDTKYSTAVTLNCGVEGKPRSENSTEAMADVEFIYGGGFNGPIIGNTRVNLDNGRVFSSFGGSCNANILGYAETYVGLNGFPYLRESIYGGNDLGGEIKGVGNFDGRVSSADVLAMVHATDRYDGANNADTPDGIKDVLQANAYVEYRNGSIKDIFGGCSGNYDYVKEYKTIARPKLNNAFVNFRPDNYTGNGVGQIYGAGEGASGDRLGDKVQNRSYVLIDIGNDNTNFKSTEAFGSGMNNGLGVYYTPEMILAEGTNFNYDKASAIIDLARGQFGAVYGGAYNEGITGRTVVNVPAGSTININNIFGGAYGTDALPPCDVYESNVNYNSGDATVTGAIYGGNNNVRRTIYGKVNINAPVWSKKDKSKLGTVFGAGHGSYTWSEYTQVNLNEGAKVDTVYGGGRLGQVLNAESVQQYMLAYKSPANANALPQHIHDAHTAAEVAAIYANWSALWKDAWTLAGYFEVKDDTDFEKYAANTRTNLANILTVRTAEMDERTPYNETTNPLGPKQAKRYNTNVIIHEGATVASYAYGGGLGDTKVANSGDVIGTTYIAVLGGTVVKDVYAAGRIGKVQNAYGGNFTASANAYVEGGTVRNIYGGGYEGHVGKHDGSIYEPFTDDVLAETHVVIGKAGETTFAAGVPAITRNVYGGGEGGSVYGTSHVKVNNGYIGYRYKNTAAEGAAAHYEYVPEVDDNGSNIEPAGNVFGGGYVVNSYVDETRLEMYGGTVRGSLYGGGEVGSVGRGTIRYKGTYDTGLVNNDARIFRAGKTKVTLYDGWVKKNVFGGGRGYDNWGGDGTFYMDKDLVATLDMNCKGFVFGQTEVNIHGGEIGTEEEMQDKSIELANKNGNVFGGGDVGFVYSAYQFDETVTQTVNEEDVTTTVTKLGMGKQNGTRYDEKPNSEGYYYKFENGNYVTQNSEYILTEDCKVLVEPWCKAVDAITLNGKAFKAGEFVPASYLNYLGNKNDSRWDVVSKKDINKNGIIIHNAIFAGGNTSSGSTQVYANTTTVYGNATASVYDVYHRDLITVGTGHTGGLYGEGNLTLVDGYRELNITNYGTDYYSISPEITYAQYEKLPEREAAYYEIRYKCAIPCTDKNGKNYGKGSTISADELATAFEGVEVTRYDVQYEADGKTVKLDSEGYPISTASEGTYSMLLGDGVTPQPAYWIQNGVCSRYAGRIMNTIQRADFCGVYGSRMVMQGAQDRVPSTVDYTNYTINRVREVSLNKKVSVIAADASDDGKKQHGNYFGIYNIVNFLGALTSDVDFGDETSGAVRTTDNEDTDTYQCDAGEGGKAYGTATFYDWKKAFHNERKRNNGNSYNKVALASGVYLELTTAKGEGKGDGLYDKDWGYITGVVELDLINVQTGMGGGFVYARNEHGKRSPTGLMQTTLATYNSGAVTKKAYTYNTSDANKEEWQTSGNFVHSTQTIIDDCYNIGNRYKGQVKSDGTGAMPAHYWYIKGSVYVYDQYISAYTGSPNAYSEKVNIPLTITSASHGKMTLLDVQPNRYAYYSGLSKEKLAPDGELLIRDVTYKLNDPINYWDWCKLSTDEQNLFVKDTYVTTDSCQIDGVFYPKGYVMLPEEYTTLSGKTTPHVYEDGGAEVASVLLATVDSSGNPVVEKDADNQPVYKSFSDVFHESNNMSHTTGYILTYNVNNPMQWETWYTPKDNADGSKVDKEIYDKKSTELKAKYENGPTYTPTRSGIFGQQDYIVGNIISDEIFGPYDQLTDAQKAGLTNQASFERAYIVTTDILETTNKNGTPQRFYKNAMLPKSDYVIVNGETTDETLWNSLYNPDNATLSSVAPAFVVTSTIQLNETDYIYRDTYMTAAQKATLKSTHSTLADDIEKSIVPAYYCTSEGKYGGDYYEQGHNYRATAAFSGMSDADRSNFTFNYDALDLLIDPDYLRAEGVKYQYDGHGFTTAAQAATNPAQYSLPTPIDYTATFKESDGYTSVAYIDDNNEQQTAVNGTELTRTEYERLLNERYHYAPIKVMDVGTEQSPHYYYVVNKTLILGDTPYAAGQVIDNATYDGLNASDKAHITRLTFSSPGTYYFCRESYTIETEANGGKAVTDIMSGSEATESSPAVPKTTYSYEDEVPAGVVIDETNYTNLTNNQKNFIIHGLAPTETSTLYVVRNSNINDLTTEKIITVIYQYDFVESDVNGLSITPVSERHVLNIHISFKSGVPTVEDIQAPTIVLPGTTISITKPYVTPGAYEVTGGGWELFDDENDAESHTNGIPYTPNDDPLYLYQDQYLVAYYAKTYLGKTYSNAVPVSVANYHDLKKVMGDEEHHYYIDHKDVIDKGIDPKIYINDYSQDETGRQNGLDLFKDLYDLSLVTSSSTAETDGYTVTNGKITGATGTANKALVDHYLLDNGRVGAGQNLEFFLRTDIDHGPYEKANPSYNPENPGDVSPTITEPNTWTSIGGSDCFAGTLHGDGHHLSGLSSSLFSSLCGDVYNLGVSGTFTGAGIAETGDGYVENCWVSTTSTAAKTSKPVLGTPSRAANDPKGPIQIVNCYYEENDDATNPYTNHAANSINGTPTRKTSQAFYNGEVAYDLNGFYLYKRYCDNQTSGSGTDGYSYWKSGVEGKQTGYYGTNDAKYCSSGGGVQYVENRFKNGDFVYAGGSIPSTENERLYTYTITEGNDAGKVVREWYPIWPDDYLFFGQSLNYGHVVGLTHQDKPSSINRGGDGHLLTDEDGNRVYRAPGYYRSKVMGAAHFNPNAIFAQTKNGDSQVLAYQNMTAIDFSGSNGDLAGGYQLGLQDNKFYTPLLDDDGLTDFTNVDLTKNLLVYTSALDNQATASGKTAKVVGDYLAEPDYSETDENYRTIAVQPTAGIRGHWVENGIATRDHFLVDKEDFNAPIRYSYVSGESGTRMWYQRMPENYVDITWSNDATPVRSTNGWEGVSIPFKAELVTTDQKGEITHFYQQHQMLGGGDSYKYTKEYDSGHEYWLREFKGITGTNGSVVTANLSYPEAITGADATAKTVTNTFLWDYYYQELTAPHHQDQNNDTYQTYYSEARSYPAYPRLSGGISYIIGFPGERYYEFDLSGTFEPATTAWPQPGKLDAQTITFVSNTGATIEVSDDEVGTTADGYTFKPNYLNNPERADNKDAYLLNADGDSYVKADVLTAEPFRPYFLADKNTGTRSIVFGNELSEERGSEGHGDPRQDDGTGSLNIYAKNGKIFVESSLNFTEDVRIVTPAGITVATFPVKPGQTVEVRADATGMYIVHTLDGQYTKKVAVNRTYMLSM